MAALLTIQAFSQRVVQKGMFATTQLSIARTLLLELARTILTSQTSRYEKRYCMLLTMF
jgi:hypothetical protein